MCYTSGGKELLCQWKGVIGSIVNYLPPKGRGVPTTKKRKDLIYENRKRIDSSGV